MCVIGRVWRAGSCGSEMVAAYVITNAEGELMAISRYLGVRPWAGCASESLEKVKGPPYFLSTTGL